MFKCRLWRETRAETLSDRERGGHLCVADEKLSYACASLVASNRNKDPMPVTPHRRENNSISTHRQLAHPKNDVSWPGAATRQTSADNRCLCRYAGPRTRQRLSLGPAVQACAPCVNPTSIDNLHFRAHILAVVLATAVLARRQVPDQLPADDSSNARPQKYHTTACTEQPANVAQFFNADRFDRRAVSRVYFDSCFEKQYVPRAYLHCKILTESVQGTRTRHLTSAQRR